MTASSFSHAARVIAAIAPGDRADLRLREYLGGNGRLSPLEKRDIVRLVAIYFRWLQWLDPQASPIRRIEAAAGVQEKFDRDAGSIKPEALAARAVPGWLAEEMELSAEFLRQLQQDPALWIRARPGKRDALRAALGKCQPTDLAPDALRFEGEKDLFRSDEFQSGQFEIQDLASQLVGIACDPAPGQTWWDACAGEGGKTLHLADLMQNKGLIWASDRSAARLESLKRRAGRARLFNYRTAPWDGSARLPTKTKFDGILLDAPCSGIGTWRRNPQARWSTSLEDVRELAVVQLQLLTNVANSLKPGGRLVYSVCTLTRSETSALAETFSTARPDLKPVSTKFIWPQEINANGMFVAVWKRSE